MYFVAAGQLCIYLLSVEGWQRRAATEKCRRALPTELPGRDFDAAEENARVHFDVSDAAAFDLGRPNVEGLTRRRRFNEQRPFQIDKDLQFADSVAGADRRGREPFSDLLRSEVLEIGVSCRKVTRSASTRSAA